MRYQKNSKVSFDPALDFFGFANHAYEIKKLKDKMKNRIRNKQSRRSRKTNSKG